MRIFINNKIKIENYTQEVLDYCKETLVLPNPEFYKREAQGRWTGNTQREFVLYERVGTDLLLPFGCFKELWQKFGNKCEFINCIHSLTPINYQSSIKLYPYQETAVKQLLQAKNGILVSPCGSGKTQMALELIARIGGRTLWLTHTGELLGQSMERAKSCFDLPVSAYGTITAGKVNIGSGITFATVQTMCNIDLRQHAKDFDVIVVDECFPNGTKILTPNGEKKLQNLKIGDIITSYNRETDKLENKPILNVFKHKAKNIVVVKLCNKKEIVCTKNHPFFTKERGWVNASELRSDDYVMFFLRERNRRNEVIKDGILQKQKTRLGILQSSMCEERLKEEISFERRKKTKVVKTYFGIQPNAQRRNCRKNDEKQSYVQKGNERTSFKKIKRNGALSENSLWKRNGIDSSATKYDDRIGKVCGSICRISYSNKDGEKQRLSNLLQSRYCDSGQNDSNRNRRFITLRDRKTRARQKERHFFEWVRVDSVKVQEQTSDGTFGGLCSDGFVYNIEVADNNNYFANNVLVHNCHKAIGSPTKIMQFYKVLSNLQARYKIGLTATPKRSDGLEKCMYALLGEVAHTIPKEEVKKFTCPVKVAKFETGYEPNLDVVLAGDGTIVYSSLINDLIHNDERNDVIARNTVNLLKNEYTAKFLVLSDRVEHLSILKRKICEKNEKLTDKVVQIMALSCNKKAREERRQILKDLNDGSINVVLATYALAKEGLDVPNLNYVVFASPQKDETIVTQSAGRVGRKADGKEFGIVIDYTDSSFGMLAGFSKKRNSVYKKLEYEII